MYTLTIGEPVICVAGGPLMYLAGVDEEQGVGSCVWFDERQQNFIATALPLVLLRDAPAPARSAQARLFGDSPAG